MGLHLITGYAGTEHVTAGNIGFENAMIFGEGKYVFNYGKKFEYEILTNNSIRIYDGEGIIQGRHFSMPSDTYQDVAIANGSQNRVRNDLICVRYQMNLETGAETASLVVLQGPEVSMSSLWVDPEYNDGNILDGDVIVDFPLYRVNLNGLAINVVEPLFSIFANYNKQIAEMKANFTDGVDSIYNAIVSAGTTPKSKALADVVASIPDIVKNKRVGTATAAQVLTGYTFSNNGNTGLSGSMANRGAVSQTIKAGGSYTIPAGYHNGGGKVSASNITITKIDDVILMPTLLEDGTVTLTGLTSGKLYLFFGGVATMDVVSGATKVTTYSVRRSDNRDLASRIFLFRTTGTTVKLSYTLVSNSTDNILFELS